MKTKEFLVKAVQTRTIEMLVTAPTIDDVWNYDSEFQDEKELSVDDLEIIEVTPRG